MYVEIVRVQKSYIRTQSSTEELYLVSVQRTRTWNTSPHVLRGKRTSLGSDPAERESNRRRKTIPF